MQKIKKINSKKLNSNFLTQKTYNLFHFSEQRKPSENLELRTLKKEFNSYTEKLKASLNLDSFDNEQFLPQTIEELNSQLKDVVQVDENEHPCFTDINYVKRKNFIQKIALNYKIGDKIPLIDYTEIENKTWEYVTSLIYPKIYNNCCKEYIENLKILMNDANVTTKKVPQISDINNVLKKKTGFTILPVGGLLRPRFFLNLLAFKVFSSTQFIRPLEKCEHSGEPDILHEVLGHTSMLCDENFASFSQEIGISSLGASNEDLKKLANIYWFTIEYGLVKEYNQKTNKDEIKVYGGGIIPSIFEIDYSLSMKANYWGLDFEKMQTAYYDYVNLSKNYFVADSIESMKNKFQDYSKVIKNKKPWLFFDKEKNKLLVNKTK